MSEAEPGPTHQPDPMQQVRELRDAYLSIWSKNLIDAVNTEGYAQASGATLEAYLNIAGPFKEATEQAMLRTLQQLNMPSSVDFAGLAGRFTNFEMQLDNLDAKLDRIEKLLTGAAVRAAGKAANTSGFTAQAARQAGRSGVSKKRVAKQPMAVRAAGSSKRTTTAKPTTAKPTKRNVRTGAR